MSKASPHFVCASCGASHTKWAGRCDACGAWNSVSQEEPLSAGPKAMGGKGRSIVISDLDSDEPAPPRQSSGIDELDRVLGGGLCAARPFWSAAIRGSANRRCSCRPRRVLRGRG